MGKKSIRKKLLKSFAVFSLVPVILFSVAMIYIIVTDVNTKQQTAIVSELEHQAQQLDKLLKEAYQVGRTVSDDEVVYQELIKAFGQEREAYISRISLDSELQNLSQYFSRDLNIYIVAENDGRYKSARYSFLEEDFRQQDWYQSVIRSKTFKWFELHEGSYVANTADERYISVGIPVFRRGTDEILGVVLVEANVNDIFQRGTGGGTFYLFYPDTEIRILDQEVFLYDHDYVTVIDDGMIYGDTQAREEYDQVLKTTSLLNYWQKDFETIGFGQAGGFVAAYNQLDVNDWIAVLTLPESEFNQTFYSAVSVSVVILSALVLTAVYASYSFSRSITRPIFALKENVKRVQEGNFETEVLNLGEDEIGELGRQFNEMVVNIRRLMYQIRKEHERQRHYELMLLQAQINPHFLYNTLDSIMWLIRMKNLPDAERMLDALTRFFKTGLNKGQDFITLEKEVDNVESYLIIQLMRYKTKLSYRIDLDPQIAERIVPKLILQPLVENAIYHGIKGLEDRGTIVVECRQRETGMVLEVSDNGKGIGQEQLKQLQLELDQGIIRKGDSYGLTNVNERISLLFGSRGRMEIESSIGVGMVVRICIEEEPHV